MESQQQPTGSAEYASLRPCLRYGKLGYISSKYFSAGMENYNNMFLLLEKFFIIFHLDKQFFISKRLTRKYHLTLNDKKYNDWNKFKQFFINIFHFWNVVFHIFPQIYPFSNPVTCIFFHFFTAFVKFSFSVLPIDSRTNSVELHPSQLQHYGCWK